MNTTNKDKKKKAIPNYFAERADTYEYYSDWCKDSEVIEIGLSPLKSLSQAVYCLDLGGGTGYVPAHYITTKKNTWILFDITYNMLKKCNDKDIFKVAGDAHLLPFKDKSIDFLFCRQLIHYVDINIVIPEIKRVLSPQGIFSLIQKSRIKEKKDPWLSKLSNIRHPEGTKSWSIDTLKATLEKYGFEILLLKNIERIRKINFDVWISKNGVLDKNTKDIQLKILKTMPKRYKEEGIYIIKNGYIYYPINWYIFILKKN